MFDSFLYATKLIIIKLIIAVIRSNIDRLAKVGIG